MSATSTSKERPAAKLEELPPAPSTLASVTSFGHPRDFLDNRFVYVVISPRARGLSIGINMNPDKFCNFDCLYCEVNRDLVPKDRELDNAVMATELDKTLYLVQSGQIWRRPAYCRMSGDLLRLRHVALSGDGEPTLCPQFAQAVEAVIHLRARQSHRYFRLILITNGTGLDSRATMEGLQYFTREDEIWVKLDAGTQSFMDKINRSEVPLAKVMENSLKLGRRRPITIQSVFSLVDGEKPPPDEITQYIERLKELKTGGAQISLVQIYSATRPKAHGGCEHLPLRDLSLICRRVRAETGLKAEVF